LRVQRNTSVPRLQIAVTRLLDRADIDPDDYPVETVELPQTHGKVCVHRVFPCPECFRPVVCLEPEFDVFLIVDAVESSEGSDSWYANPFSAHYCRVQ
jgi:hypothetical protein